VAVVGRRVAAGELRFDGDFSGEDVEAAIDTVEQRYRAIGAPVRFQTFDETSPVGLTSVLSRRGYRGGETTTTMFKRLQRGVAAAEIVVREAPWPDWLSVYLGKSRRIAER